MNQVQACAVARIFDDARGAELMAEYAKECANPLLGATNPQRSVYEAVQAAGMGQCFAATVDGALCGFAFVVMAELPHYGHRMATVESLFIAGATRKGALGLRLMEAVESYCQEAGCAALFYSVPVGSRMARLLFLSGDRYVNTGHTFCRRLK